MPEIFSSFSVLIPKFCFFSFSQHYFSIQSRKDKKNSPDELAALEKVNSVLIEGRPARQAGLTVEEMELVKGLMLLTLKPVIYAANVADTDLANGNELSRKLEVYAKAEGSVVVLVSAQFESELALLEEADREDYLTSFGLTADDCGLKVTIWNSPFS